MVFWMKMSAASEVVSKNLLWCHWAMSDLPALKPGNRRQRATWSQVDLSMSTRIQHDRQDQCHLSIEIMDVFDPCNFHLSMEFYPWWCPRVSSRPLTAAVCWSLGELGHVVRGVSSNKHSLGGTTLAGGKYHKYRCFFTRGWSKVNADCNIYLILDRYV